jgi:Flp pilus assembly protein CpaB
MASDRGTLSRSAGLGGDQQGSWVEPTAAHSRRLPSAPRERKPALFALAILLVALGAGAAGLLVIRASAHVEAIEIVQQVNAGAQIPGVAMEEVGISAGSQVGYVSWSYAAQVEKDFASTTIPAGTLLTQKMVVGSDDLTTGQDIVGLSLKAGQLPGSLQPGDKVDAFAVTAVCGINAGDPVASNLQVTGVSGSAGSTGNDESVTVAVKPSDAGALTCAASSGDVALALLPSNG